MSTAETPAGSNPLTLNVYNRQGESVGTVQVDPAEFGGTINRQLLHDVVVMHLANQRSGTHSTLRRGEVAGSTKKLFRQKGTGNARAGTRRTNKRRGGGTAKGPKPRDYEYHLPRKAVRAATRMAILSKLQDNETVILDDLSVAADNAKTKEVVAVLKALTRALNLAQVLPVPKNAGEEMTPEREAMLRKRQVRRMTWLIGIADFDPTLYRCARNIPGVELMPTSQFNAYTVLRQKRLVLTRAALEALRKGPPKAEAAAAPAPAPAQQ
jgi:large subunit ribosomal protein L4